MIYEGMIAEMVAVEGDGGLAIPAYLARPLGPGPFPGVVLVHHLPGWDEIYRDFTRKFAHYGYAAICHNLYQRAGEGKAEDVAAKVRAEGGVPDEQFLGDTDGAVKYLRNQPWSSGKLGIFGTCSGGRHAYLYACRRQNVDACLDMWGGRVVMGKDELNAKTPVAPIDYTKDLQCPVLGIFGNEDRSPSPEQVDRHEEELKKHGKAYEFYRYDDAGHGIFYYNRPMYRVEAAMDGWEKVFAFLKKHVG